MAYNNNREWDYGKDSWGGGPSRVRGREEDYNTGGDYNGEGKRRKFNAGVSAILLRKRRVMLTSCFL